MVLSDFAERSKFSDASVGENDIDSSPRLDGFIKTIKVGQFRNVSLDTSNAAADRFHGFVEFLLTTACDEYVGPFLDEELCRSQPYSGRATSNHCYFPMQLLSFGHW